MDFKNKVALITGSSRGIGKATATELAKHGCNVIVNYINGDKQANDLCKELQEKYNVSAIAIKADIGNENEVKSMVEQAIAKFQKIDILVNNTGIVEVKDFKDRTLKDFQETFRVNLFGFFLVSKYIGLHMMKNKYGKIINISSTNAINAFSPETIDYSASKAGIISLTQNLALEFAPYINVNAVAPGWVNTDMNANLDEEIIKKETSKIYLKRFAEPEEIAKLITFLASDDAGYINGEVIKIDGGYGGQ